MRLVPASRFAGPLVLLATVVAMNACGEERGKVSVGPASVSTSAATTTVPATIGPEPAPETTETAARTDQLISPADTEALDEANRALAEVCDDLDNGREPSRAALGRLHDGVTRIVEVLRIGPNRIFVPPARPERERTVRAVASEAAEAMELTDCAPAEAARLRRALAETG